MSRPKLIITQVKTDDMRVFIEAENDIPQELVKRIEVSIRRMGEERESDYFILNSEGENKFFGQSRFLPNGEYKVEITLVDFSEEKISFLREILIKNTNSF